MTGFVEGVATAQSSLAHGGQVLGTVQYLRREKFMLSNGLVEDMPVISGNAVRGALRDHAASIFYSFLGEPQLSIPLAQSLWSGGAVTKAKGVPLTGERLRKVRQACPPLAIFGWGSAGRIISGSLSIGKLIPLCSELTHVIPEHIVNGKSLTSYWDLTQLEEFSRFPDQDKTDDETNDLLMRYGVESFIPGCQFYFWSELNSRNEIEKAFWNEVLTDFMNGKVQVGGLKGRGYGKVRVSLIESALPEPVIDWRQELSKNMTPLQIIQVLSVIT